MEDNKYNKNEELVSDETDSRESINNGGAKTGLWIFIVLLVLVVAAFAISRNYPTQNTADNSNHHIESTPYENGNHNTDLPESEEVKKETTKENIYSASIDNTNEANVNELIIGITEFEPKKYSILGDLNSFEDEVINEVCRRIGMKPTFRKIDYNKVYDELKSGNIDCIWKGVTDTAELENNANMTVQYLMHCCFMIVKTENSGQGWGYNPDNRTVAAVAGSDCEEVLKKNSMKFERTHFIAAASQEDAVRMVATGEADIAIVDNIGIKCMNEKYPQVCKQTDMAYKADYYGAAVKEGNQELLNLLGGTIREMRNDGTISNLAKKYGLEDMLIPNY